MTLELDTDKERQLRSREMTRTVAHVACGFFLVAAALAVLTAGPLTANAAIALIDRLPDTARVLGAIAIAL